MCRIAASIAEEVLYDTKMSRAMRKAQDKTA